MYSLFSDDFFLFLLDIASEKQTILKDDTIQNKTLKYHLIARYSFKL